MGWHPKCSDVPIGLVPPTAPLAALEVLMKLARIGNGYDPFADLPRACTVLLKDKSWLGYHLLWIRLANCLRGEHQSP
jgi:hypothetical protein